MQRSSLSVLIVIGVISVLVLSSLAPSVGARPVSSAATVIHSSLINVSPSDPQAAKLMGFEVRDPTVSGQFIADIVWRSPDGLTVSGAERTHVGYRFGEAGVYTVSPRMEALSPHPIIEGRRPTTLNLPTARRHATARRRAEVSSACEP